jgi:hypothetical protein
MMKRNLLYLAVITAIALLLLLFTPGQRPAEDPAANALFLEEVAARINDVSRVEIISAGNATVATLERSGGHWQLGELGGYRADWPRLQSMLAALAQARVTETKTDKPEYYARLGVEDIDAEDAGGVLVRLSIADETTAVLVGNRAQGRTGQYVRLQNEAASLLVDREIDVSSEQLDWADSRIVDINAAEVAEVEIIHPGGERVLVTKISADQTDFDPVGLPAGREIKSSWAVNSLGSVLSMLDMESVQPDEGLDWSDAVNMRLMVFSGMEIMADMLESGDQYLVRLRASRPGAKQVVDPEEESETSAEQKEIEERAAAEVDQLVDGINQKVEGWAYAIAKYKFDAMVKKPEDLLKPLETT